MYHEVQLLTLPFPCYDGRRIMIAGHPLTTTPPSSFIQTLTIPLIAAATKLITVSTTMYQ